MSLFGERLKKLRVDQGLSQKKLAEVFSIGQTTIANYENNLRLPSHELLSRMSDYFEVSVDYLIGRESQKKIIKYTNDEIKKVQKQFMTYLMEARQYEATKLIVDLVASGVHQMTIYRDIFQETLYQTGTLWEVGKLSVGEEHFITNVIDEIMGKVNLLVDSHEKNPYKVITLTVYGDIHSVGSKMLSHYFEWNHWNTYHIGNNIPSVDLLKDIKKQKADLLAVSVTGVDYLKSLEMLIHLINSDIELLHLKIIVGGQAFIGREHLWREIGADAYAQSFEECIDGANHLIGRGMLHEL